MLHIYIFLQCVDRVYTCRTPHYPQPRQIQDTAISCKFMLYIYCEIDYSGALIQHLDR